LKAGLSVLFVSAVVCGEALAQGLPGTFDEALKRAQEQYKNPSATREYNRGPFMGYFGPIYAAVFNGCIKTNPIREKFVFVLALDAEGKVARVYADRPTAIMRCVEEQLGRDRFPRPPVAPYFAEFRIEPPK
jgi:hypothetical protein